MAEYTPNARRSKVRFKPDPVERDDTPMAFAPRNHVREHGRSFQGNPSRSDGAAAPIRKSPSGERVALTCTHCGWTKQVLTEKVVASYRGHFGYAHPNRRLPEPFECRRAAGLR